MRSFAIANIKGGSGKTTVAVNLAAGLALSGCKVLLLDLDPQGSSSYHLLAEAGNGSLADCLAAEKKLETILCPTLISGLSVAPGDRRLARFDNGAHPSRERLSHLLRQVPEDIDYVLLDTPPTWGSLLIAGLSNVDGVLIPVATRDLDLRILDLLHDVIDQVRRYRNPRLRIAGIIPNRVVRTRLSVRVEEKLRETHGARVYPRIRENARLAEAGGFHAPIQITSPSSSGALDFAEVIESFKRRENSRFTPCSP